MSELEKMHAVKEKSQAIGEFLEWLGDSGYAIAEWVSAGSVNELEPVRFSIEQMLAMYFDIDLDQVEKEKRAILDEIRGKS